MQKIAFRSKNNKITNIAPTKLVVLSFALIILAGAALLTLPAASRSGESIGFLNALFTATSATCVTGLVVVDTFSHWTLFGQIVILCLIQTGGLGIITLATFFSILLGKKVGLKGMLLAQESTGYFTFEGVLKLIRKIVFFTLAVELLGAILLTSRFVPLFGLQGLYFGLFHAVSAFCNAGFDLMGALGKGEFVSLIYFKDDPVILYTIAALIITGGLGFMVWTDIYDFRKTRQLLLHSKVVVSISICLILLGSIFFFCFEYNNPETMGNLTFTQKVNASIFQSISPRTAGFNSIDQGKMNEISKMATIMLMFIGAAPGSTGGGIKVTTFGVILMAIICQIRGTNHTIFFRRRVHNDVIGKALAITGLSAMLIVIVTTVLLAVEKSSFINILYEATSAFGTVGLSTGITPSLHSTSKIFLILTMFFGRVGPLTFALALSLRRTRKNADVVYPEGKIVVG